MAADCGGQAVVHGAWQAVAADAGVWAAVDGAWVAAAWACEATGQRRATESDATERDGKVEDAGTVPVLAVQRGPSPTLSDPLQQLT